MKVKFLKECKAPQSWQNRCGDGCCSWTEWEEYTFFEGDVEEAVVERNMCFGGIVDVSSLTFNVDYVIVEYP